MTDGTSRSAAIDRRQADAVISFVERHRAELAGFLSELIQLRSVFPPGKELLIGTHMDVVAPGEESERRRHRRARGIRSTAGRDTRVQP